MTYTPIFNSYEDQVAYGKAQLNQAPPAPSNVPRNRGELSVPEPKFNELIRELLRSYQIDDDDSVMELRASLKGRFHLSDDQINHHLFKTLAASKLKPIRRRHDSVDLTKVVELSYLVDGWLPKGDVSLLCRGNWEDFYADLQSESL